MELNVILAEIKAALERAKERRSAGVMVDVDHLIELVAALEKGRELLDVAEARYNICEQGRVRLQQALDWHLRQASKMGGG